MCVAGMRVWMSVRVFGSRTCANFSRYLQHINQTLYKRFPPWNKKTWRTDRPTDRWINCLNWMKVAPELWCISLSWLTSLSLTDGPKDPPTNLLTDPKTGRRILMYENDYMSNVHILTRPQEWERRRLKFEDTLFNDVMIRFYHTHCPAICRTYTFLFDELTWMTWIKLSKLKTFPT